MKKFVNYFVSVFNGWGLFKGMHSFHFNTLFLQKALEGFPLFAEKTEAHPAVRAEVPWNRDQFYGKSILLGFLFSPDRMVSG
jgi:hypothetical protein